MSVSNDQLADLIATTLADLPQGEYEVMWDDQNYEFAEIYHESRRQIDGGTSIQRNVVFDETGNARYRRMYDTDNPAVQNVHTQINVPWCQIGSHFSWDKLEILRNKNSEKGFINLMETRRMDGYWSLANLIEERGWKTPTSPTDNKNPYGVPYYLNMLNAGDVTAGFRGQTIRYQDGSTGTVCAGVDAATEAKWRNYADVYTRVDNSFLRKLRRAFISTRFRTPRGVKGPGMDKPGRSVKLYTNLDMNIELQDLADKRDDSNTSKDLAGKQLVDVEGTVYFNRRPIVYIPQLDGVTYNPLYCVDWSKIQPIVQDGYWMLESEPMTDRSQHTTFTVFIDGSHQNLCINRRTAGFVLHEAIPA